MAIHRASRLSVGLLALSLLASCKHEPAYQPELRRGDELLEQQPAEAEKHYRAAISAGAHAQGHAGVARALERQGKFDEACQHYQVAKAAAPGNPSIRLALVRAELALGQQREALAELRFVVDKEPQDLHALTLFAVLARAPADVDFALQRLDAVAAKHGEEQPLPLESELVRMQLWRRKGQPDKARATLRAAAPARLESARTAVELASVFRTTGEPEPARLLLKAATRQFPTVEAPWLPRLELEFALGRYTDVRDTLKALPAKLRLAPEAIEMEGRLASLDGDAHGAALLFRRALERTAKSALADQVERWVLLAQALSAEGRGQEALGASKRALRIDPESVAAQVAHAAIVGQSGRPEEAARLLEAIAREHPKLQQAHELLIANQLASGQVEAARASADRMVQAQPKSVVAYLARAKLFSELSLPKLARGDLAQARVLAPSSPAVVEVTLGIEEALGGLSHAVGVAEALAAERPDWRTELRAAALRARAKALPGAITHARAATRIEPRQPDTWRALATYAAADGQGELAAEAIQRVIELLPGREDSYAQLSRIQQQLGDEAALRETYERWLKVNPRSLPALNNLAMLCAAKPSDVERGLTLAERAYAIDSTTPAIEDTLGWLLVLRGKPEDMKRAIGLLEAAAESLETGDAFYHLAKAQLLADQGAEASGSLRRALAEARDADWRSEAERLLSELRGS